MGKNLLDHGCPVRLNALSLSPPRCCLFARKQGQDGAFFRSAVHGQRTSDGVGRPPSENLSHPFRNLYNMLIDCDQCAMRETSACDDCVVNCLLGDAPLEFSETVAQAMDNLAEEGLVPRLRLIPAERRVS